MELSVKIKEGIHWIGVNDRSTDIFEGMWPLPKGVSYNSYIIDDDKVAILDTVKHNSYERFLGKIKSVIGDKKVDYLIVNHMEPDHSGSIKLLLNEYPEMKIIGNKKTVGFLENFFGITSNIEVVDDAGVLNLGRHKLTFHLTPMVHWPETMVTYETTEKILFSADAFGGFGALTGGIFDDEVDIAYFEDEILRYFSNIVGKYCVMVQKAIQKLQGIDIQIIAPTHGPIWRSDPASIIKRYDRWSKHEAEAGVVIVYASMYGNTETMMEAVARGMAEHDINRIRIHDVSRTHVSYLIRDAWRFKALILGSPTYDTRLFPLMDQFIKFLKHKQLKNRILGLFGTYGWSGGGVSTLKEFAEEGNWDLVDPIVEAHCSPTDEDLNQCFTLGKRTIEKIKSYETCG
ncbi:MAG: FprA family A-type flavoprotein [Deltaproteobacteria bacterium]|jgi:flavorubredoxin|nr:FprA family A-type flavoprotein [Deltaproteobacteria bacterium]